MEEEANSQQGKSEQPQGGNLNNIETINPSGLLALNLAGV
jgi:hypothetical protein